MQSCDGGFRDIILMTAASNSSVAYSSGIQDESDDATEGLRLRVTDYVPHAKVALSQPA